MARSTRQNSKLLDRHGLLAGKYISRFANPPSLRFPRLLEINACCNNSSTPLLRGRHRRGSCLCAVLLCPHNPRDDAPLRDANTVIVSAFCPTYVYGPEGTYPL